MFNFLSTPSRDREFTELVERYREPVYRFIRRRVNDHDDASDISQEVFIRVYKNLDKLRDAEAERAWIYRIATNETMRFLENKARSMTAPIAEDMQSQIADSASVDYDGAMDKLFAEALNQLTPRQRDVFDLRYYQELSYDEIAKALDSNESTMKATFHQAKKRITDYILEHNI